MNSLLTKCQCGMTLVELLVASVLVSLVMVGAISVDLAIRRSHKSASEANLVSMQVSGAMLQMTRDAARAIGDKTNPGIVYDDTGADYNICFRHDTALTPSDYSDDPWVCYSQGDTTSPRTERQIYRCITAWGGSPLSADTFCPVLAGETPVLETVSLDFFDVIEDAAGSIVSVDFSLESRADPGSAEHPINNPGYTLESRVSPPGLSR